MAKLLVEALQQSQSKTTVKVAIQNIRNQIAQHDAAGSRKKCDAFYKELCDEGLLSELLSVCFHHKQYSDEITLLNAAESLAYLFMAKNTHHQKAIDENAITILLNLNKHSNVNVQQYALEALNYLSRTSSSHFIIIKNSGIEKISSFLTHEREALQQYAAGTLSHLAYEVKNHDDMHITNFIEKLVNLLEHHDVGVLCNVTSTLLNLTQHGKNHDFIKQTGAIPKLRQLMNAENVSVRQNVVGVICNLIAHSDDASFVSELGGIAQIMAFFQNGNKKIRQNAAEALFCLASRGRITGIPVGSDYYMQLSDARQDKDKNVRGHCENVLKLIQAHSCAQDSVKMTPKNVSHSFVGNAHSVFFPSSVNQKRGLTHIEDVEHLSVMQCKFKKPKQSVKRSLDSVGSLSNLGAPP